MYKQDYGKILKEIEGKKKNGATCQFVLGDIRNTPLLEQSLLDFQPNFLFHFAELVGIYICDNNPEYTREINFEASTKVIDLGEKLNIPTIYNSTSSVYGNRKENVILDEHVMLPEPIDNYCKNKLEMEKYIANKKKRNPDFKVIMLRLATIYGLSPRIRLELLPNHFTYCAVAKGSIKISEPEAFRAQIDIDDVVDAYFAIMGKELWPKVLYNVGHYNLQKIQIAKIVQSIVDCKIEFTDHMGDLRNLQIDSSTFNNDFDWKPERNLEDTIVKITKWIKDNLSSIEGSKFVGLINTPLDQWLKMI